MMTVTTDRNVLLCSMLALLLCGACSMPQDPSDFPFRTSSILYHENGARQRAQLIEPTELHGYLCQEWIWWYEDGCVDNLELARDAQVQGHHFPAATRVFFDREGRLAHAWLSQDTIIDSLPCRGRWKIDTAFHPNGRVRAFFPPEDWQHQGVSCEASVFHPVYLYPDGSLQQCQLAKPYEYAGRVWQAGETLKLPPR